MSNCPGQRGAIAVMSRISEFDAGYICGLVTGEGSFTGDRRQPVLAIKLHEDDPAPLLFVREKLGGKIYGPYCHDGRRLLLAIDGEIPTRVAAALCRTPSGVPKTSPIHRVD